MDSEYSSQASQYSYAFSQDTATSESTEDNAGVDEHGSEIAAGDHEHHEECAYCKASSAASLSLCTSCSRWFCNARGKRNTSHIVSHLVRSRHKTVALHPRGPLGNVTLECYHCGQRNPFVLGFVAGRADQVVVLLCRSPCAAKASTKDVVWDTSQWLPLIQDRAFISWLVAEPNELEQINARKISNHHIVQLEDMWRDSLSEGVLSLAIGEEEVPVDAVQLRYCTN